MSLHNSTSNPPAPQFRQRKSSHSIATGVCREPRSNLINFAIQMNIFTTEHPLAAPRFYPRTKSDALYSYGRSILYTTVILSSLFMVLAGIGMTFQDSPDVPDPSWLDSILSIAAFIMGFPSFLFVQVDDPSGSTERIIIYLACAFDGFFWSIASVTSYHLLKRLVRRRQFRS